MANNITKALAENPQLLQMYMGLLAQGQQQSQAGNQSALISQLLGQASQKEFDAKQANELRYQDILQLLGMNRNDVMSDVNQFGQSITNDTNENFDRARNNALADLAARGLSGSTIRSGVEESNAKQRSAAQLRNEDALLENRSAANERTLNNITGVMERRTDSYPDASGLMNLALQYGMSGGAGLPIAPPPVMSGQGGYAGAPQVPIAGPGYSSGRGGVGGQPGATYAVPGAQYGGIGALMNQAQPAVQQQAPGYKRFKGAQGGGTDGMSVFMDVLKYLGQGPSTPSGPTYISGGQTQGFAPVQWENKAWGGTQPVSNTTLATRPHIPGPVNGYRMAGGYYAPPTTSPLNLYGGVQSNYMGAPTQRQPHRRPQQSPKQQPIYRSNASIPYNHYDANLLAMAAGLA